MNITDIHKDAESIELKVTSEKSVFNISTLDTGVEQLKENSAPECKYFTNFTIDVYAVDGMGKILADIGFLKGVSIEAEITFTDGYSFLELCDMISSDLYGMAAAITDSNGSVKESVCHFDGNILYIENLYIEEKYRGMGIGRYLLDNADSLFLRALNYSHRACILKPYPQIKYGKQGLRGIESPSKSEIAKLEDFYKKSGYKFIGGSDYMLKKRKDEFFDLLGV